MAVTSNSWRSWPAFSKPGMFSPLSELRRLSLLRIEVIIEASPTTMPASRGARKVMLERMSETISARRSRRRSLMRWIFLT